MEKVPQFELPNTYGNNIILHSVPSKSYPALEKLIGEQ